MTAEPSRFRETAAACDWTLVIAPEFDDHLRGLSQTVLDVSGRLLGSLPAAIALTGDKLATAVFWHERGVPLSATEDAGFGAVRVISAALGDGAAPGAGSQGTFLIRNREDGLRVLSPVFHECGDDEFIVQEYVRGQAASVALLIAPNQTIPLLPARQLC